MIADANHLEALVRELMALAPDEREHVVAEASRRGVRHAAPPGFTRPTLRGGAGWVGGDLRREDLYGDEGR